MGTEYIKKYYLDINSWLHPETRAYNRGMGAALGKISEFSCYIEHVCLGSKEHHEQIKEMINRMPERRHEKMFKHWSVRYVEKLTELPKTMIGWHDFYLMTKDSTTDWQPLVEHLNGSCLIIDGEYEDGWVKLCEDLGMTRGAWDNDHLIQRIPLGRFRSEVSQAQAKLSLNG